MASESSNGSMENKSSVKDESSSVDIQKNVDPELDAILDSALADFDKPKEAATKPLDPPQAAEAEKDSKKPDESSPEEGNYDFLADAMNKSFEDTFNALLADPNIQRQFAELAASAEQAASTNNAAAFAETVEKTLSGLNLNAESLQGDPNQQVLWEQLAETLGAEGGGGSGMEEGLGAMGGMFQNMVKQLLSKELLYQPLKEVSQKYQVYIEEKQHDLEPEKLIVYRKQLEIIEKVVEHLDGDSDDHSLEEKNSRFEVLLDLLQRMHELGAPPQEVVGEGNMVMPNFGDLGEMGQIPNLGQFGGAAPQDPSQCSLM
ncbi:peroxisomal biogenesis factor 19 [Biomphalaria pfeifferi]|uniref:Peroxin-19 n=1 Tax=Biomphalaria pfeifferi TaxID=112525 RepID=A0AAD8FAA5_BIOPF|nr:peroxisomal biogenesis factor 19 [Biomphalaria pfeifferi]